MARRAHSIGAQPLPGLAVRLGVISSKLAEVTLAALYVWFRQAGGVAGIASRAQEAERAIGGTGDGIIRPVFPVVSLQWVYE